MPDPVNAAEVLADARRVWRVSYDVMADDGPDLDDAHVDALLAYGDGDPVVITDDGRLGRKTCGCPVADPVQP